MFVTSYYINHMKLFQNMCIWLVSIYMFYYINNVLKIKNVM